MSQPLEPARIAAIAPEGLRLGKYTLIRPLGSGGMAQVFLAHKPILDGTKVCALKMSIDLVGADEGLHRSLLNEIRIASKLTHSNIVQVFDAGIVHGILFIELECIDGMDLSVLLESMADRQTEMSVEMAIFIAREILEGLHHAHTYACDGVPEGIIHRDLSPHNVLISSAGEVKIMDFGIGKTTHDRTSNLHIKGKVRYMAPEHAQGEAGAQADLFSVGAIFYEMLEGEAFRQRADQHAMLAAAASLPAPQLRRDDVPALIVSFYQRLTARKLEDRFANAAEALRALSLWRGLEIHKQDLRTFYERQLDRGRHSGYTRDSIAVPESFFRLVEAIKSINPEQPGRGAPAVVVADAGLRREQQRAIADVRQAARQEPSPPTQTSREPDAPSIQRRSSGLGNRARPQPEVPSTTIDAPPLHMRGKAAARVAAAEPPAPQELGPAGTVRLDVQPQPREGGSSTSVLESPLVAPRHRPPSVTPPPWDSTSATPLPSAEHGTMFEVSRPHAPRTRLILGAAALSSVALAVLVGWMLGRDVAPQEERGSPLAVTRIDAETDKDGIAEELDEIGPVLGPMELAMPSAAVAEPVAQPSVLAPVLPAAVESAIPEPASEADATPVPVAKVTPTKRSPKKVAIEVRLARNFIDGEVKIGKRTWVVKATFDVVIPEGQYALAWRELGTPTWQSAGRIVLTPGLQYLLRVGPKSLSVSSSPAKGAPSK